MADLDDSKTGLPTKIIGSDSIGAETTFVNSTPAGELLVSDQLSATGTQGSLTVGLTAVEVKVGALPLSNRKLVTVFNNSLVVVYWGRNSLVTTSNGTPIFPNQLVSFEGFNASSSIFLIAGIAGNNIRITEN